MLKGTVYVILDRNQEVVAVFTNEYKNLCRDTCNDLNHELREYGYDQQPYTVRKKELACVREPSETLDLASRRASGTARKEGGSG